jgi:hypothetical protein
MKTPLVVEIREDRSGPGTKGFGRTGCGCIMTHVCWAVGLPTTAQYENKMGLHELLKPYGAMDSFNRFEMTVGAVQSSQDYAWEQLLGQNEIGTPDILAARNAMERAVMAARKLGVVVKWVQGNDWAAVVREFLQRKEEEERP